MTYKGQNESGKTVRFYINYSEQEKTVVYRYKDGIDLLAGETVRNGDSITIAPWNFRIVEE